MECSLELKFRGWVSNGLRVNGGTSDGLVCTKSQANSCTLIEALGSWDSMAVWACHLKLQL